MILEILFCSPDTIINSETTRLGLSRVFSVLVLEFSKKSSLIFEKLEYVDLKLVVGSGEQDK